MRIFHTRCVQMAARGPVAVLDILETVSCGPTYCFTKEFFQILQFSPIVSCTIEFYMRALSYSVIIQFHFFLTTSTAVTTHIWDSHGRDLHVARGSIKVRHCDRQCPKFAHHYSILLNTLNEFAMISGIRKKLMTILRNTDASSKASPLLRSISFL